MRNLSGANGQKGSDRMIYADNAATTRLSSAAREAMLPYLDSLYGNPSSLHAAGREARAALETARERVASCMGAAPEEILFTSGGSESDNQALITAAAYGKRREGHILFPPPSSITPFYIR